MRTTISFSSSSLAILLIISGCSPSTSSQSGEAVERHTFSVASLFPSSTCSSSSANKAIYRKSTLTVIHRDGPCDRRFSREGHRDHAELRHLDEERVASIQSKFSAVIEGQEQLLATGKVRLPTRSGASLGVLLYMVNVGLGTPMRNLTLVFDTVNDLTWTQCLPCGGSCYLQVDPLFDPSKSSSYRNISCSSTTCAQIASGTSFPPSCSGSTCEYRQSYRSGSHTYGLFATERLTLSPRDVIENFQFGCGQNNGGRIGRTDGMIGLGRNRISLVEQSASKYGRYFSYCLPDISGSVGYLSLGKNGGSSAAFTPMLTLSDPSYYGINLVAISVGGKQLPIPQSIFSKAGTILDSGTVTTRLPQTAYNALRSAFRQAMSNYTMVPGFFTYDTCYDFSNHTNASIPTVALTFHGGVTISLVRDGIIEIPIGGSVACLAFLGNGNDTALGIIGNKQQQKFEVIYDIPGRRIGFMPDGC